jgi:hypothetical protein
MHRTRVLIASLIVAAVAGAHPAVARPSVPMKACGSWELVSSPNVGSAANQLFGVAAVSPTDVWAVGSRINGTVFRTLVLHWDGTTWAVVPSPNVGGRTNALAAVTVVSASDAWAVGHYDDGATFRTLVLHWNGTAWAVVPSPNAGSGENALAAVTAIGAGDVWAAGYRTPAAGSARLTLTEHWDGGSWKVVASASMGSDDNFLFGVSAASGRGVWAVGAFSVPWLQTLTEHWDGTKWTVVPSPNFGDGDNVLYAAVSLPHGSVVAVGDHLGGLGDRTLVERWDGAAWSGVESPSPGGYLNELFGVAATGSRDVWAVGFGQASIGQMSRTLALHWSGNRWRAEPTPNPGSTGNVLTAVARVPGTTEFWAVGRYADTGDRTLVLHRC